MAEKGDAAVVAEAEVAIASRLHGSLGKEDALQQLRDARMQWDESPS